MSQYVPAVTGETGQTGTTLWYQTPPEYKEAFKKIICIMLGPSKISQELKNEFINSGIQVKEFRGFVSEYFPHYADKIKLWEKLHGE